MKLEFDLEFFYYPEKIIFDGRDEYLDVLEPHVEKFVEFFKNNTVEKILQLFIYSYAKKYANLDYWISPFISDIKDSGRKYPETLDIYTDIQLVNKEISRLEFKEVIFKNTLSEEHGKVLPIYIEFIFKEEQIVATWVEVVKKGLKEVGFTEENNGDSVVLTPKNESGISKVTITKESFKVDINPEKWKHL